MSKVKSYFIEGIPALSVGFVHDMALDGYRVTVAMGLGRAVVSTMQSLGARQQDAEIRSMAMQAQAKIAHATRISHEEACDEWLAV